MLEIAHLRSATNHRANSKFYSNLKSENDLKIRGKRRIKKVKQDSERSYDEEDNQEKPQVNITALGTEDYLQKRRKPMLDESDEDVIKAKRELKSKQQRYFDMLADKKAAARSIMDV